MRHHRASTDGESASNSSIVPWTRLERRASRAFAVGGGSLLASAVVPVGLAVLTDWAWASGLVLAGVAGLAIASGLLGLYPGSADHAPRLAAVGATCGAMAGVASVGVAAMGVVAPVAAAAGVGLGTPMGVFAALALSSGTGLALGFLAFGIARWNADGADRVTPALLTAGGAVLLVPVVGELLRFAAGVASPSWVLFPVLLGVAIDAVAIGYVLRRTGHPRRPGR